MTDLLLLPVLLLSYQYYVREQKTLSLLYRWEPLAGCTCDSIELLCLHVVLLIEWTSPFTTTLIIGQHREYASLRRDLKRRYINTRSHYVALLRCFIVRPCLLLLMSCCVFANSALETKGDRNCVCFCRGGISLLSRTLPKGSSWSTSEVDTLE